MYNHQIYNSLTGLNVIYHLLRCAYCVYLVDYLMHVVYRQLIVGQLSADS